LFQTAVRRLSGIVAVVGNVIYYIHSMLGVDVVVGIAWVRWGDVVRGGDRSTHGESDVLGCSA